MPSDALWTPCPHPNFTCVNIGCSALQQLSRSHRCPSVPPSRQKDVCKGGAMPRVMLDDPDGTLSMLRDSVAQFAIQHSGPRIFRDKRERAGDLDSAVWTAMAQAGWTGLLLPDTLGGAGLGMREQAILSEALGRALIAEPHRVSLGSVQRPRRRGTGFRGTPATGRRHRQRTADRDAGLAGQGRSARWNDGLGDPRGRRVRVERHQAVRGGRRLRNRFPRHRDERGRQRADQCSCGCTWRVRLPIVRGSMARQSRRFPLWSVSSGPIACS